MATSLGCYYWSSFVRSEAATPLTKSAASLSIAPLTAANPRSTRFTTCATSSSSKPATTEKRALRGIMKPKPISPAMQELLGVAEIPRTQALKQIWAYIKEHNLQDPENKKIIVCDEKLKKIFGGRERVGFLEVSGLINPHFMK